MTETINGIQCHNHGANNYSCGLEAITFDCNDATIEEVAKLPGVYLHPSMEPDSCTIYALKGTFTQYLEFCQDVVNHLASKYAIDTVGLDPAKYEELRQAEQSFKNTFKPWFWK